MDVRHGPMSRRENGMVGVWSADRTLGRVRGSRKGFKLLLLWSLYPQGHAIMYDGICL